MSVIKTDPFFSVVIMQHLLSWVQNWSQKKDGHMEDLSNFREEGEWTTDEGRWMFSAGDAEVG